MGCGGRGSSCGTRRASRSRAAREPSMMSDRGSRVLVWRTFVAGACILSAWTDGRGDSVIMKSGIVYREPGCTRSGQHAGLHLGRLEAGRGARLEDRADRGEQRISDRREVSAGAADGRARRAHAQGSGERARPGPWNERGRRSFRYIGSRLNKPIRMEQAIIEIGPHIVKYSGRGRILGRTGRDQPDSAHGGDEPAGASRAEERRGARASGPVLDGHRLERRGQEGAGSAGSRLSPGRPEGAGGQCPALHPPGRGGGAAGRDRRRAARRSSTSAWPSCSRRSRRRGFRPSFRSRSARSSGMTSSSTRPTWPWPPTCASWLSGCRPRARGSGKSRWPR